jgi:hypothetical protein
MSGIADSDLEIRIRSLIDEAPADAVLTIRVEGAITDAAARVFSAARLRALAPATMNVEVRPADGFSRGSGEEIR